MTNLPRGSLIRTYFSLQALHTAFSGFFESKSLHFLVTQQAGQLGVYVVAFAGALGLVALIDTVVNDLLPPKYSFNNGLEHRHLVFMFLALVQAAELFVAVHYVRSLGLSLYCILNVIFITIAAFQDVQIRYKGTQQCCN